MKAAQANLETRKGKRASWKARYDRRHGYVRLANEPAFPNGRRGRVTIYRRGLEVDAARPRTFILSWCWRGRHRKERVLGDKFDAVRRADQINESLAFGLHAIRAEPLGVDKLVSRYMEHLEHRAQAGDLSHRTPVRYHGALKHLARFVNQLPVKGHDPTAWFPSRDFVLHFKTYLHSAMISPNGHPNSSRRPFAPRGIEHIVATTCAMVRWAVREGLLPPASLEAFSAPHKHRIANPLLSSTPLATTELIGLIRAADLYQLALFSFHIFHGARVAEPCFVMIEFVDLQNGWMHYRCIDELGDRTKSRIDKQLPVPSPMIRSIEWLMNERSGGPLLLKRRLLSRPTHQPPNDLSCIIRGVQQHSPQGYADRAITGLRYLKKAGAISSDDVRREFAH